MPLHTVDPGFALRRLSDYFGVAVLSEGEEFLRQRGYRVFRSGPAQLQMKLSAYEAGIGVYGKSGVILHPQLGNRLYIGAILTDAELAPDPKLVGFEPCRNCNACVKACPAKAFDTSKTYPDSFAREKCEANRGRMDEDRVFCNRCWAICSASRIPDAELLRTQTPTVYGARQAKT